MQLFIELLDVLKVAAVCEEKVKYFYRYDLRAGGRFIARMRSGVGAFLYSSPPGGSARTM